MASQTELLKLNECDPEEMEDIVRELIKAFGIQCPGNAFENVKTFGDLCDVFEQYLNHEDKGGCTSQQAFYRVRSAVIKTKGVAKESVKRDTRLDVLFPKRHRRRDMQLLRQEMGVPVKLLTCNGWIDIITIAGTVASLIALFVNWQVGLAGIFFFPLSLYLAHRWGKEFYGDLETVETLVEKLVARHYMQVRREKDTINKKEIVPLITDVFHKRLLVDKAYLTRDASLI